MDNLTKHESLEAALAAAALAQEVTIYETPPEAFYDDARALVLPAVVHFALDVVDRSQTTAFGALHDARAELRVAVDGGIELAQKASSAGIRLARKLVQRVDDLTASSLGGAELLVGQAVTGARASAIAAAERVAIARTIALVTVPGAVPAAQA